MASIPNLPNPVLQPFYIVFPWLNGSSDFLFSQLSIEHEIVQSSLEQTITLIFKNFPELQENLLNVFEQLVTQQEEFKTPTNQLSNLAMYPILQLLISILGNRVLGNALANLYAKHVQAELIRKDKKGIYTDRVLIALCENIGIYCETFKGLMVENTLYNYKITIPAYLNAATSIPGEEWRLINKQILNGKVLLRLPDVVMLIRETVRSKTKPDFAQMNKDLKTELLTLPEIKTLIDKIEAMIEAHTQRFQSDLIADGEKIGSDLYPPCMRAILYHSNQGENLVHMERLAICFYFLNTNHTIEETIDIFRTLPDYDEKITRYQVEFASGEGGKGKKYSMFNCAKLKTLHLCKADDPNFGEELCRLGGMKRDGTRSPIKHPISDYVFWKKVEIQRAERAGTRDAQKISDTPPDSGEKT